MEHLGHYSASKQVCLETEWKSGFWWKFKTSEKAVVGQISEGFLSKWSYINREAKIPLKQFKIPDSSQQKYFWGNEVIFSEIPQKQKKVSHWKSAWFPHSLLLYFRDCGICMYYHKDFKGSSQVSPNEGLWYQFPCLFSINFVPSPVKGQDKMLLEIQKVRKCSGIWL